jgi:maleylpyruvate isomerase
MKLYNYWRSSASWRVRAALHLKAIPFEYVSVHLVKDGGQQHGATYTAMNPMAQVPLLELDDGRRIGQSVAILEYLEEAFQAIPLLPADPYARAETRQLVEIINSGIQPFQNLTAQKRVREMGGDADAWTKAFITTGLAALEAIARDTAGAFLVGNTPTLADCALVPQLYAARRFGVDLTPFPTLTAVDATCAQHEDFERAHADNQPDATP